MDPKSTLWNSPPPSPRTPREAEARWTLRKDTNQAHGQLLGHGEFGWEFQLLRDGGFYFGRRFDLREQAIAFGEEIRRAFEADDWRHQDDGSGIAP